MVKNRTMKMHLRDYLEVIRRRRLPIIIVFVLVVGIVAAYTFTTPKYYTAQTTILIEQGGQRSLSLKEALTIGYTSKDFYQTQYQLLESRAIAEKVVKKIQLYNLPEFGAPNLTGEGAKSSSDHEKLIRKAASKFRKKMGVSPIQNSRLVDISFTSLSPEIAAKAANAIAQAYIDFIMGRKMQVSQMAVTFLTRRIEEQRHKLQASQILLQKYMEKNELANFISPSFDSLTAKQIKEMEHQLVQAQTNRKEVEARYRLALSAVKDSSKLRSISDFLENPIIQKVRERELELSNKEAELSQKYGNRHPKMIALRAEMASLAKDRKAQASQITNALHNRLKIALAKEQAIEQALKEKRQEAMAIRKKAIGFNVLKRDVETNQQLYDMLLAKVKEARVAEDIDVGQVMIVDKALLPKNPSKPRIALNMSLAVLAGLGLALFWGFLLDYMDNTIKFPEQLEEKLDLPFLGNIPFDKNLARFPSKGNGGNQQPGGLAELLKADSTFMESLRVVRAGIAFSRAGTPPKSLVVTSSTAAEGKSVISATISLAFAEAGVRTLLLDADLRRPRQHRIWGLSNMVGLSNFLSGQETIDKCIHRNLMPNIDVLTSGPIPPNPSELFQSELMNNIMAATQKSYSMVIIDSPPVMPLADPLILGHLADGIVMVVSAGKISFNLLEQAVEKLEKAHSHILGVIINQTEKSRSDYYYTGYRYKYYYGYKYEKESEKA